MRMNRCEKLSDDEELRRKNHRWLGFENLVHILATNKPPLDYIVFLR